MRAALHSEPTNIALSYPVSDNHSIDTALLSPPPNPLGERDVPFKPTESDNISLSMKKRHAGKSHSPQSTIYRIRTPITNDIKHGNDALATDPAYIARSRSMPSLDYGPGQSRQNSSSSKKDERNKNTANGQGRRWTLPSKAQPTKGLTTLKSVAKLHALNKKKHHESSPALITLRRATLNPSRKTSLTFFPPPTFSRTKPGLISYFLKSVTGVEDCTSENIDFLVNEIQHDRADRSPRLVAGNPQPSLSAMAEPLLTEVLSNVSVVSTAMNRERRCSTRYVSGASVYEAIWDENHSPSNASDYSPPNASVDKAKTQNSSSNRRQSAAMDKLETQLFKAVAQSRRESCIPQDDDAPRKSSFQTIINTKLSRIFNERSLYHLPRSKASRVFQRADFTFVSTGEIIQQTLDDESPTPPRHDIEFFPPLCDHGDTSTAPSLAELTVQQIDRRSSVGIGRPRMGSLLGVSSHVRRRSLRDDDRFKRKGGVYGSRRKSSGFVLSDGIVSEETRSLLHGSTWEGENPW